MSHPHHNHSLPTSGWHAKPTWIERVAWTFGIVLFLPFFWTASTTRADIKYLEERYNQSQWAVPQSPRIIGDGDLYQYAGAFYIQTGKQFTVNPEVPPFAKTLYGLSTGAGLPFLGAVATYIAAGVFFWLLATALGLKERTARWLTLLFLASPLVLNQTHQTMLDLPQVVCMLAAWWAAIRGRTFGQWRWVILSGIFLGLFAACKFPAFAPVMFISLWGILLPAPLPLTRSLASALNSSQRAGHKIREKITSQMRQLLVRAVLVGSCLAIISALTYLATSWSFFLHGGSIAEWFTGQKWMVHFYLLSGAKPTWWMPTWTLLAGAYQNWASPWTRMEDWHIIMPTAFCIGVGYFFWELWHTLRTAAHNNQKSTPLRTGGKAVTALWHHFFADASGIRWLILTGAILPFGMMHVLTFWPRYLLLIWPVLLLATTPFWQNVADWHQHRVANRWVTYVFAVLVLLGSTSLIHTNISLIFPNEQSTLNLLQEAVQGGNVAEIYGYLSPQMRAHFTREQFASTLKSLSQSAEVSTRTLRISPFTPSSLWQTQTHISTNLILQTRLGELQLSLPLRLHRTVFGWTVDFDNQEQAGVLAQIGKQPLTFTLLPAHQGLVRDSNGAILSQPIRELLISVHLDRIVDREQTILLLHRITPWEKVQLEQLLRVNLPPNRIVQVGTAQPTLSAEQLTAAIASDPSVSFTQRNGILREYPMEARLPGSTNDVKLLEQLHSPIGQDGGVLRLGVGESAAVLWKQDAQNGSDTTAR